MAAIGLNHVDSIVEQAFLGCLCAYTPVGAVPSPRQVALNTIVSGSGDIVEAIVQSSKGSPIESHVKSEDRQRLLAALSKERWLGAGWRNFVPIAAAFASVMVGSRLENFPWLMGSLFGLSFVFSGASLWHTSRKDLMVGFRSKLPAEVLLAALPLMNLPPIEHSYVETVALLIDLHEKLGEHTASKLLLRSNDLLANNRQLETHRHQLVIALDNQSAAKLEAERAAYLLRLNDSTDPVTRQSLQQSLEMCELRLQDSRTMEQNLQRVTLQQEAIHQTLSSSKSSLVRIKTTPSLASPAIEEITQAFSQLNEQYQAEEAAIQEVAAI